MLPLSHACMRVSKAGCKVLARPVPWSECETLLGASEAVQAPLCLTEGVAAGKNNDVERRSCQMITQRFWLPPVLASSGLAGPEGLGRCLEEYETSRKTAAFPIGFRDTSGSHCQQASYIVHVCYSLESSYVNSTSR